MMYTFNYRRDICCNKESFFLCVRESLCTVYIRIWYLVCFIIAWYSRLNLGLPVCEACASAKLLVQPPTFKCLNKINTQHPTIAFCEVCSKKCWKALKGRGKIKEVGDTEKPITKIKRRIFTGENNFILL